MDDLIRSLAREAIAGDLDAAKQLVRQLERAGNESREPEVIDAAITVLKYDRLSNLSGDHDDLIELADEGPKLAKKVLEYFFPELKFHQDAFGVQEILLPNGQIVELD